MSAEDLEQYESELELQLYREYKDVVGIFTYAVETERRFYLCNAVDLKVRTEGGDVYYEVSMGDAWVWDMYRPARFVKSAKVLTFRDVSIEEIATATSRCLSRAEVHCGQLSASLWLGSLQFRLALSVSRPRTANECPKSIFDTRAPSRDGSRRVPIPGRLAVSASAPRPPDEWYPQRLRRRTKSRSLQAAERPLRGSHPRLG